MAFSFLPRWQSFSRHRTCIGLDISASCVRAVALRKQGRIYHVNALSSRSGLAGAPCLDESGNLGELEPLVDLCRVAITDLGPSHMVAMALPIQAATCVRLTLPSTSSPLQRMRQVRAELTGYLPYPIEEAAIDFCTLPSSADHPDDQDIAAVAVPQSMIDERLALAQALQLSVSAIGIDAWMAAELTAACPRHRNTAVVHTGTQSAWIALPEQPPATLAQHSQAALLKDIAMQTGTLVSTGRLQRIVLCGDDPGLPTLAAALRKYAGIPTAFTVMPSDFAWEAADRHDALPLFHTALAAAAGGLA